MAILLCRRICMATRGCTSSAASNEPHVFRVLCLMIMGTPAFADSEGNTAHGCPRHAVGAVGHLRRPAVPAPVVRDHAVAAPWEEHHLGIPVVSRERPAVAEDDRLARAPHGRTTS